MSAGLMTRGFSDAAIYVESQALEGWRRLNESNALGMESGVRDELASVWESCWHADWDGYGAQPVLADTLRNACLLIDALPWGSPPPSIGAEPDGHLTLEWHRGPWRTLSVSVTPNGDLHYAAVVGPNRTYGTEAFFGEAPEAILELIQRIY